MADAASTHRRIPLVPAVVIAAVVAGLIFWFAYMSHPAPPPTAMQPPSPAEQAYATHVSLSNLSMKAAENLIQQQIVEVRGTIANNGTRALTSVYVDCVFSGINGNEVYRERQAAFASKANPLKPGEARPFRLAFDHLPEGWNQVLPRLTIARIVFASNG